MKETLRTIFSVFMVAIALSLTMVSCQKNQNDQVRQIALDGNTTLAAPDCAGDLPDSLQVPEENRLNLSTYGKGVQIYRVQRSATDPATFLWMNIAPWATLFASPDFTNQVAIHYAGPTWAFTKG